MTHRTTQLTPAADRVIEQQLRNWELARAKQLESPRDPKQVQDFIAISRQVGSGGSEIGHLVAERLHWPLFDREILHRMSADDAIREQLYASMDERDISWLEQMREWLLRGRFLPHDYFAQLTQCVLTLARKSPAVFLGRGADMILPAKHGLHVRIVAPLDLRVRQYAERLGLDEAEARGEVLRIDRERAEFIRHYFHCEIDDPARVAFTINTGSVSIAAAADLVLCFHEKLTQPQ